MDEGLVDPAGRAHNVGVSRKLGSPDDLGARGPVPPAVRSSSPGWRDPRLWVGVAIVAASVVVGARVLADADDTVQVWAVAEDAGVGERLDPDGLVARRVRFADDDDLTRYFTVDDELPDDLTVLRGLGGGELLPRSAIGTTDDAGTVTVSLAVTPLLVPSGVGPGAVVDVYVTGDAALDARVRRDAGEPALEGVTVVAAPPTEDGFAPSGERQVELAVPDDEVGAFYGLLGSLGTPVVSLAQVG